VHDGREESREQTFIDRTERATLFPSLDGRIYTLFRRETKTATVLKPCSTFVRRREISFSSVYNWSVSLESIWIDLFLWCPGAADNLERKTFEQFVLTFRTRPHTRTRGAAEAAYAAPELFFRSVGAGNYWNMGLCTFYFRKIKLYIIIYYYI